MRKQNHSNHHIASIVDDPQTQLINNKANNKIRNGWRKKVK